MRICIFILFCIYTKKFTIFILQQEKGLVMKNFIIFLCSFRHLNEQSVASYSLE